MIRVKALPTVRHIFKMVGTIKWLFLSANVLYIIQDDKELVLAQGLWKINCTSFLLTISFTKAKVSLYILYSGFLIMH